MHKFLVTALLAGTAFAPAFAQDVSPFTGPRVEALVGYDALRSGNNNGTGDDSIDGISYGVGVGYDFDLGNVVLGIEGEFTESSGEQDFDETIDGINVLGGFETGRDLYVGARVGFKAGPATMVYAKGGYTNTAIEGRFAGGTDSFELDTNLDGFRVGAGVEHMFGQRFYGKVEYRYSNYSELNFDDDIFGDDFDTEVDVDRHQVVAGVGFRF